MSRRIAIIPARGGSKRIPRKNIRLFCGQPLIRYSIDAAKESGLFDDILVSTDDEEVAQTAVSCGASVPFMRSVQNANDFAPINDVLLEVLDRLGEQGERPTTVCCIYPTAPFLSGKTLRESAAHFEESGADKLVAITPFAYPIQRSLRLDGAQLAFREPQYVDTRSQDLEPYFHDVGQFYWFDVNSYVADNRMVCEKTSSYLIDPIYCQDIDNLRDWEIAEFKYDYLKSKGFL